MKNLIRFSFFLLLIFCTGACSVYRPANEATFKKHHSYPCKARQKNVFLFYEGQQVDFKFNLLGNIEASGKFDENEQQILDRLKLTAYQNCANAIIDIKTEYSEKNYGGNYRTGSKTYLCKTYRGQAVRIESDSLYKSNIFGNWQDLSFLKNEIRHNHERRKRAMATAGLAIGVSVLFIGIYVITAYR